MSKETMSQELTEMIQEEAKPKPKKERLIIRWLEEGESPDGNLSEFMDKAKQQRTK